MENIHVSLRLRPLNEKEIKQNDKAAWEVVDQHTVQIVNENIVNLTSRNVVQNALSLNKQPTYHYDKCYDETASNKYVYENSVQSILKSSLNGVNGTIFMYGQSGSGKTYTMMGYEKKQQSQQGYQSAVSSNPQLSIFNYSSNQPNSNQQRKRNSSSHANSLSPLTKANNGSGLCFLDVDDIDFDKIKSNTPEDNKGILMLALQDFFDTIKKDEDKTYVVRCSYVEIYNDQIYDLLNPVNKLNEILQVGLNQNKEFYIKGVTQESVSTLEEAYDVLKTGETNKHYAQTTMNHHSSRSHSIFKLYVQSISSVLLKSCLPRKSSNNPAQRNVNNQELLEKLSEHDSTLISTSELNFIDLAGSEKVSNHSNLEEILLNSGSKNQSSSNVRDCSPQDLIKDRVKEGQFINKSLFFLTQVISQIAEGKPLTHIPYRNSPLTKILKSSLGGNSRTMIILCITPVQSSFEQSYSTIRFGLNAKKIENKVRVNIQAKNNEEALQLLILDYEKKIRDLEHQKNEEKTRNSDLIKKLNEMAYQTSQIQQRLMNSNRKNIELSLTRTSNFEGTCQTCQKNNQSSGVKGEKPKTASKRENSIQRQKYINEKQRELISEQTVHCDYVGVLFPTKNNITVGDVCPQVKRNWQDLVFDYEGRYAFHQYQLRNKQFAAYLQMWDKVNANIEKVTEHHLKVYECAQSLRGSLKNYEGSLESVLQKLKVNHGQQQNSAQFMVDLSILTIDEIINLESTISKQLERIIQEKYKRNILQTLDISLQQNILSQIEKQKFSNIIRSPSTYSSNLLIIDYPESEKKRKMFDQQTQKTINKTYNAFDDQYSQQLDTSIDDIKKYLKDNEGPKGSYSLILNSFDQEKELINSLFYRGVDPQLLAGANQIDWTEADFKHLKCIITRSTYAHLNILNQANADSDNNDFNKKTAFLTPKVNKFSTNNKSKNNDIEEENEKKEQLSFDDEQPKRNKPSLSGYFAQSHQQNLFLLNNNSGIEERLQYHQNPIPKQQEEEIQQNFDKLQNHSCFFEGYSTISNINSNYTPSNASFNQNVIGSQRLMNTLTNQLNVNGIINSNAPSNFINQYNSNSNNNNHNNNNNSSYGHLTNFNSVPQNLVGNSNSQTGQIPNLQNFLSNQAFVKQSPSKQVGYLQQEQMFEHQNNLNINLTNTATNNYALPGMPNKNDRNPVTHNYMHIHDDESDKNPLNSIKQNTNSVPDSVSSMANINLIESTKQIGNPLDGMLKYPNNQNSSQINNVPRSQSVHEPSSSNLSKQNSNSKDSNSGTGKYYLGPIPSSQQNNKIHSSKVESNTFTESSLNSKKIPSQTIGYNLNLNNNSSVGNGHLIRQISIEGAQPPRNFDKPNSDLIKNNSKQSFERILRQQESALTQQADHLVQQYSVPQHKRHQSTQNSSIVNANSSFLSSNNANQNNQSAYMTNVNVKARAAESLTKDDSIESLSHRRAGSAHQQANNYQKIIGSISKGSVSQNDNQNLREINMLNNSNLQQNQTSSNIHQLPTKQLLNQSGLATNQNYQSANATPVKQAIKLNNTISIDIIQLQNNSSSFNKPLGLYNKQPQSNSVSQNSSIIQEQQSSNRKQSHSLHVSDAKAQKIDKTQLHNNYSTNYTNNNGNNTSINNISNTNNYLSANNTYSGYSHLSGNKVNQIDENHIQQILQKSTYQKNIN